MGWLHLTLPNKKMWYIHTILMGQKGRYIHRSMGWLIFYGKFGSVNILFLGTKISLFPRYVWRWWFSFLQAGAHVIVFSLESVPGTSHMDRPSWDKDSTTSTNFAPQQRHTSTDFGKTEGALAAGRTDDRGWATWPCTTNTSAGPKPWIFVWC